MFFGIGTENVEFVRDECSFVGCGSCKFFNVRADQDGVESTCKRLDHKRLKFYRDDNVGYYCGQGSSVMCRDFEPSETSKWLRKHWPGTDEYVGSIPDGLFVDLRIGNDPVRYRVSLKEFYDGTFIKDGKIRCYGKEYYLDTPDGKDKQRVVEKFETPVFIDIP